MLVTNDMAGSTMGARKVLTMSPARHLSSDQQAKVVRLARLAMLVECEGSITIGMTPPTKTRNRPALTSTIGITNTAKLIIDEAKDTLNLEGIGFTARPKRYGGGAGKKLRYDLNIHGFVRVVGVLSAILPYLRSKKRQAEIVLEFVASRKAAAPKAAYSLREWELATEVRRLNGRMPEEKAVAKAMAYLALPLESRTARTSEYYERYVQMCAELRRAINDRAA